MVSQVKTLFFSSTVGGLIPEKSPCWWYFVREFLGPQGLEKNGKRLKRVFLSAHLWKASSNLVLLVFNGDFISLA